MPQGTTPVLVCGMAVTRKISDRGRATAGAGRATRVFAGEGVQRSSRKGLWIAVTILATMLIGGTAMAAAPRRLPTRKGMPVEEAIAIAMQRLGAANPHSIAQLACSLVYPAGCSPAETDLVYQAVIAELGPEWADIPAPTGPVQTELVQQVGAWMDGLSPAEHEGLRSILGPVYYDPLFAAVSAGDGIALTAEVVRLRALGMDLYANDRITALAKYAQLQALLGPKLNELVALFL